MKQQHLPVAVGKAGSNDSSGTNGGGSSGPVAARLEPGTQGHTPPTELDGLSFAFCESMSGHLGVGATDPEAGAEQGRTAGTPMRFDLRIRIPDLGLFLRLAEHAAELTGTVSFTPLGGTFAIREGRFNLFVLDPATGARQMVYSFRFTASDGLTYCLRGHKQIVHQPGRLDVFEDMTTLLTTVYRGEDERAPAYGAGKLFFKLTDAPAFAASIQVGGARSWKQKFAACAAFTSFAYGVLRDEYLRHLRLFYDTSYQNLVLAGVLRSDTGAEVPFFFVSGVHDRGFPWGDDEAFSDVLLAIGDGRGGWERYACTDRALEGLQLDVATGLYCYRGPLFALRQGYAASFSQMRRKAGNLFECEAEFEVTFAARPFEAVNVEFPLVSELVRKMSSHLAQSLQEELPGEHPLGIYITPHTVTVQSGRLRIHRPISSEKDPSRLVSPEGDAKNGDGQRTAPESASGAIAPEQAEERRPGATPSGRAQPSPATSGGAAPGPLGGSLQGTAPHAEPSSGPPEPCAAGEDGSQRSGEETAQQWTIAPGRTFGEAEQGTFRNVKQPTMVYGYLCAVRPDARAARVQIHSSALRHEREHWAKDQLEAFLGAVVKRTTSSEMLLEGEKLRVRALAASGDGAKSTAPGKDDLQGSDPAGTTESCEAAGPFSKQAVDPHGSQARRPDGSLVERAPLLCKLGDPVLEVNNDHFPTAVFQRRIVEVLDPSGARCRALEEDMSLMRVSALNSAQQVTIACFRDDDKLAALDRVLDATRFDALLAAKLAASSKPPSRFSVAIKPNFMFAYNRRDHSTYTDPELVHHLVRRLHSRGFTQVFVVEAQSTYGQYFDHRGVHDVATYLGYDESIGYRLVDMTEDAVEKQYLGPHLGMHPVSSVWKNADFRISFAKNKTHAYAYYTLTLKNTYGALPLANKFKEYHCGRGIYLTALEYLKAFPVDYGLIDAYLSADGPFGVFADPMPRQTHTLIGGGDLVAVDWVGASKMGIDPLISPYMKHAVEIFGKPEIQFVGDPNPYRPWLNVPAALTLFTSEGVDADYHFGNLMYSAATQMDESYFHYKNRALYMRLLRALTAPLRRTFFRRTAENPSRANTFFSRLFYKMGL